ncbi:MAG: hypothetical protein OQK24_12965 [Magnetovibrio sp.]|nr:hypothetical protein [Magnetovibrio sp.]
MSIEVVEIEAMANKVLWKNNMDPSALIARLNSIRSQKNEQVTYHAFEFTELKETLFSFINFPNGICSVDARGFLQHALYKPTQNGKLNADSIIDAVAHKNSNFIKKKPKAYSILTSLSYRGKPPFSWVKIGKTKIVFSPSGKKLNFLIAGRPNDIEERLNRLGLPNQSTGYPWVILELSARSPHEAFEQGIGDFDILRGLLNLAFNRLTSMQISTDNRQPFNKLRLGKAHTLHDEKGDSVSDNFWYEPEFVSLFPLKDLSKDRHALRLNVESARKRLAKSGLANDASVALQRYVNALDKPDWAVSFRELWAVAEFLTNTQKSTYDVTIRRMAAMYGDHDLSLAICKHLRERRNHLIHVEPNDDNAETLMMQGKRYVELLLNFYISNPFNLKSREEVGKFLDLPKTEKDLKNMGKLVDAAKHFRGF